MHKIYKVGGCVRDKLLGIESKDIDFVFVLDSKFICNVDTGFKIMKDYLETNQYTIFLSTPEMYTIRAKFPSNHQYKGMVADFVLARKEIGYVEGTRKPILTLGTLYDDLIRRDFTVNAMAEDIDGTIIDPFNGQIDLKNRVLDTPTDPEITFMDDPLRMLRAIRFLITKNLVMTSRVYNALQRTHFWDKMVEVVSMERVREELTKCFKANTIDTINVLTELDKLDYIFRDGLWLKPTFEQ